MEADRAASAAKELVEHVDADGQVLEVVTRSALRADNLRHRCTYVAVVDSLDRLVVHRRAAWKDVYPSWWDVCFGGICNVGEPWLDAAERELAEEAGLQGIALFSLGGVRYEAEDGRVLGQAYLARSDREPTCPDGEVERVDRVALADLEEWLVDRQVCLDSLACIVPLLLDRKP